MNSKIYASAIQATLNEIKHICPEVKNAFVFKETEFIANIDTVSKEKEENAIEAFNLIEKEAKALGGLNSIRIEGTKGKLNLIGIEKYSFATVISNKADENYVNTITRILVPTVVKLVDEIKLISQENQFESKDPPKSNPVTKDTELAQENLNESLENKNQEAVFVEPPANEKVEIDESLHNDINDVNIEDDNIQLIEEKTEFKPDSTFLSEPPITQLIVETLTGFLVPSDIVRIDKEIIEKWNELYENKTIKLVHIENVNGKGIQTKFKNIKSSKFAGKGVIRMPNKIQLDLETSKGDLVTIKPVIE